MSDLSLFDLAPSHRDDPPESREAGRKVDGSGQLRLVCEALAVLGRATDDRIAEHAGLIRTSAGTRRGKAVKLGFVERVGTGRSALGNRAAEWALTAAGRQWVEAQRRNAA